MRKARVEELSAALEARRGDPALARARADLRETLAWVVDPKHAERDLARLLARYEEGVGESPVATRFEAVLTHLPAGPRPEIITVPKAREADGLTEGLSALLRERFGRELDEERVFDPWAGTGGVLAALNAGERHGNEADPARYAVAASRNGAGICLADSTLLPERRATPAFAFTDDENAARIDRQQALEFRALASDLRGRKLEPCVRWAAARMVPEGVIAFLSDGAFVDEPVLAPFRAWLEREFALVAHLAEAGATFLVRGGTGSRLLYASGIAYGGADWTELAPTERHVWRTEILRPEWAEFLPLAGEQGAIFAEASAGAPNGRDAPVPGPKARRVLRRPLAPAWRTLDRKARREPFPDDGPTIVVVREPFGVLASAGTVDRRFGPDTLAAGGRVLPAALRRFRAEYGAGVGERDVLDAVLAILHHPEYAACYHEDLRRGVPRLPLPAPERLAALAEAEGAPAVGPGTAFGTGWLSPERFEPGVLPDYDDPFASPYARPDVEEGFLLLSGLGAALYRLQTDLERLVPYPLEGVFEGRVERARLSADGSRVVFDGHRALAGIPPEALTWRIGAKSAVGWAVESLVVRRDHDPKRPDDPARPCRLVGQTVTAALEVARLTEILGMVDL